MKLLKPAQLAAGPLTSALLTAGLLTFGLVGCGSEASQGTSAPTSSRSSAVSLVSVVSLSAAGGREQRAASEIGSRAGLAALLRDVPARALRVKVRQEVARTPVPAGRRLMGAVVSVGCDVPVGVEAAYVGGVLHLTPTYRGERHQECFAAVTSVALVLADL